MSRQGMVHPLPSIVWFAARARRIQESSSTYKLMPHSSKAVRATWA